MRILRIRRGFTTNSSGANEYLPKGSKSKSASSRPASTTPPPATPPASTGHDQHPWAELQQPPPSESQGGCTWSGPQVFSLLGLGVLLLFVLDRLVRAIFRKRRKADDAPPER
jgi:hypothetical protein